MDAWERHFKGCESCRAAAKSPRVAMCVEGVRLWTCLSPEEQWAWRAACRVLDAP